MYRIFPGVLTLFVLSPFGLALAEPKATSTPSETPTESTDIAVAGVVVRYRPALAEMFGVELAEQWADDLLALRTSDKRLIPILPTNSARFFYQDERMHNRPVLLRARVRHATPGLEILDTFSLHDGKPHEIYYWCDICSIKMFELKLCDCCQGPVQIREHPVGEAFIFKDGEIPEAVLPPGAIPAESNP